MNWKRGAYRVWFVAAIAWLVIAGNEMRIGYQIGYAWKYQFHHAAMRAEDAPESCAYRSQFKNSYSFQNEAATRAKRENEVPFTTESFVSGAYGVLVKQWEAQHLKALQADDARETQQCIATYEPPAPSWEGLAAWLLPPTLGVPAAAFLVWMAFLLLRWLKRGFVAPAQ